MKICFIWDVEILLIDCLNDVLLTRLTVILVVMDGRFPDNIGEQWMLTNNAFDKDRMTPTIGVAKLTICAEIHG